MKDWDNRVQVSPAFVGYIQDMLDGMEYEPEAIRIYQDDTASFDGREGDVTFVYHVGSKESEE